MTHETNREAREWELRRRTVKTLDEVHDALEEELDEGSITLDEYLIEWYQRRDEVLARFNAGLAEIYPDDPKRLARLQIGAKTL